MHRQTGSRKIAGSCRSQRSRLPRQLPKPFISLIAAIFAVSVVTLGQAIGGGNQAVDKTEVSSISRDDPPSLSGPSTVAAQSLPVCGTGRRANCIVDGDTFWLEGAKYRIANIDTPELHGKCGAERAAAFQAQKRLTQLMSDGPLQLDMTGTDRYGRTLVLVSGPHGDFGKILVSEGLAEVWGGAFIDWCRG